MHFSKKITNNWLGIGNQQYNSPFLWQYINTTRNYVEYSVFNVNAFFRFFNIDPKKDNELLFAVKQKKLDPFFYNISKNNNNFLKNFLIHGTYIENMGTYKGNVWFSIFAITQRKSTIIIDDNIKEKPFLLNLKSGRELYASPFIVTFKVNEKDVNLDFILDLESKKNEFDLNERVEIIKKLNIYFKEGKFKEFNMDRMVSLNNNIFNILNLYKSNLNENDIVNEIKKYSANIRRDYPIDNLEGEIGLYKEKSPYKNSIFFDIDDNNIFEL